MADFDINNILSDPLIGLAAGLLQAGGPSQTPISFGQALGQGVQTGQQFQSAGIQRALQNIELQKQKAQLGFLTGMNDQPQGQVDPNNPTTDPTYQYYLKGAMAGIPGFAEASQNQLATLRTKERPATKDEIDKFFPGGVLPGQNVVIDGYGNPKILGESAIKTIQIPGPNGTMVTVPYDARTGKVNDVGGSLQTKDYSKPLTGSQEDFAQRVANYQATPPSVSSRFPGAADIIARADYLIKQNGGEGLDATTFPAKMAAMKSLAAGKDYQQNSAYSTIQTHFDTLKQAFDALNNGDTQAANKLVNWTGRQFGKSAPQNIQLVSDIVNGELARVLAQGGQVTDAVRAEANRALAPYFSKGQMAEGIQYAQQLIAGKMNTSYLNAKANHIPDDVFMAHLTPEARQQLVLFQQQHSGDTAPTSVSGNILNYDPATGTFK